MCLLIKQVNMYNVNSFNNTTVKKA